jgi:hypothetical protein
MLATVAVVLFAFLWIATGIIAIVQLFRRKWKSAGTGIGISLVSFIIAVVAAPSVPTSSASSSSTDSVASKVATIGGLAYSIQGVRVTSSIGGTNGMAGPAKASGEFIIVRLRVSNVGHDSATIDSSDFHLHRGNSTYDASSDYMVSVILGEMSPAEFDEDTINPGIAKSGTVAFDVPAHTNPLSYELQVSGNDSDQSIDIRL